LLFAIVEVALELWTHSTTSYFLYYTPQRFQLCEGFYSQSLGQYNQYACGTNSNRVYGLSL
jgi:hypothetical protein